VIPVLPAILKAAMNEWNEQATSNVKLLQAFATVLKKGENTTKEIPIEPLDLVVGQEPPVPTPAPRDVVFVGPLIILHCSRSPSSNRTEIQIEPVR
jgi:hypothetical protein